MNSAHSGQIRRASTADWSIVIVNYNGDPFLSACLESIGKIRLRPRDVFVVDNASTDSSLYEMHGYPWAEVLKLPENRGFAGGANAGLARVETSVAVILNPDVELPEDYGDAVVNAFASNPRLGAAGSLLTYPDGQTIQHAGGMILYPRLYTEHRGRGEPVTEAFTRQTAIDYATGAALGLRMEAVKEVGGFDERFAPVYYEDVDLSVRMREAGWSVELVPAMRGLHHEGVTLSHGRPFFVYLHRNRIRYALKHLDQRQWSEDFVPSEIARIRHELHVPPDSRWEEEVGVEGIEMLLRGADPLADASSAVWTAPTYPLADVGLADLHARRSVEGHSIAARVPVLGWFRNLFNNLGPRWYVDDVVAQQREFNDAVVRAFEAQADQNARQDRLNREQTAAVLLIALETLGRLRDANGGGGNREKWAESCE